MTPTYAVRFVGYLAVVYSLGKPLQRTGGAVSFDEAMVAMLNLMTNQTVIARNGKLIVHRRADLATFLENLPNLASHLTAGETYL